MHLISTDVRGGIVAPERMVGTVRYDDGVTEEYWFEGPGALATSGTPWLAALLPLAATVGERFRIDLPVDSEFLQNARVLLRLWKSWHKWAHCPEIQAEAEEPEAIHGRESATFFSAGVDSWYTAIRRPDATHWIFCLGFDEFSLFLANHADKEPRRLPASPATPRVDCGQVRQDPAVLCNERERDPTFAGALGASIIRPGARHDSAVS